MRTFRARARAREGRLASPAVIGLIRCRVCGVRMSILSIKVNTRAGVSWYATP